MDRGKVLSAEQLAEFKDNHGGQRWGRYLDVDGDGIAYRTLPGTRQPVGCLLHTRHRPQRVCHLQRAPRCVGARICSACDASSRRHVRWCRPPLSRKRTVRRSASSAWAATTRRSSRHWPGWAKQASTTSYLRVRALPINDDVTGLCRQVRQGLRDREQPRRPVAQDSRRPSCPSWRPNWSRWPSATACRCRHAGLPNRLRTSPSAIVPSR